MSKYRNMIVSAINRHSGQELHRCIVRRNPQNYLRIIENNRLNNNVRYVIAY